MPFGHVEKPEMGVFSHTRIRVARLKQFHFSAFTLHPRIHQPDIQANTGEQKAHFCLHRGWTQKGEAFTRIILSLNKLGAKGEAVKEKIEKRRTRAYTRAREKGLLFRVHPTFEVMGAEMKKSTEQIVDFPVANLSILRIRSNDKANRTNSRYNTTYKCFNLEQREAWTFSTLPLEDMQGVLEIPDIQLISRHIERLRCDQVISGCLSFLKRNYFLRP